MLARWTLIVAACLVAGCTHAAEFVHEAPDETVAPVLSRSSVRIAVAGGPETDARLERRVETALRREGAGLVLPEGTGLPVEYRVELHVKRRAMSRGTNFIICWPGFIVFAPAWHGLEWPYRVNTLVAIQRADGTNLTPLYRSDLYTAYYTPDAYGVGAGLGWFLPLYSVPAFATGIVAAFVPPEHALDEHFLRLESEEWSERVAVSILEVIARDRAAQAAPREGS